MDFAQETKHSDDSVYLHVRESWAALQDRESTKCSTLMLHSVCDDDEGSGWYIEPRPGGVELKNKRSGRYLHVRSRWATHVEGDAGNLLMLHDQSGVEGNLWFVEELGPVPGPILLRNVRAEGRCLMVRQTEWASKLKGEMLTLSAAPHVGGGVGGFEHGYPDEERPACQWRIETQQESGDCRQGWVAFRSAARSVAHFDARDKFDGNGHWKSSRGWSVVADLAEPGRFAAGRELVEQSLTWRMCLSDTLPISSLHMTVCGHDSIGKKGGNETQVRSWVCVCESVHARGGGVR